MLNVKCRLVEQGFESGSCLTFHEGEWKRACEATFRWKDGTPYRLVHSYAHKAPEQYLSIYQSGCARERVEVRGLSLS